MRRFHVKSFINFLFVFQTVNIYDINDDEDLYSALKEFIRILYFRFLAVNPKDRRVVIVESVFCPTHFRNQLAKVLFLHYDVKNIIINFF